MLQTRVLRSPTVACGLKLNSFDPESRLSRLGDILEPSKFNLTKPNKTRLHQTLQDTLLTHLSFSLQTPSPKKKTHPSQPLQGSEKSQMTTAPYPQAKLADHEHCNLDSYTVKVGCPFFELAIGTSWHIFCFSIYAGSKDQPVAARESLSEPTYQTHSNSLFILPKANSLQIIACQRGTYFMVLPSVHF